MNDNEENDPLDDPIDDLDPQGAQLHDDLRDAQTTVALKTGAFTLTGALDPREYDYS